MRIQSAADLQNSTGWFRAVSDTWQVHPLRTGTIDTGVSAAVILIIPGQAYETDWGKYPVIQLTIPAVAEKPDVPALAHELAHVIDRHDAAFTDGKSPAEVSVLIDQLPHKVNASVRTALRIMWDTYIDGRLGRRGIVVETFDQRLDQLLSSRKNRVPIKPVEIQALQEIWEHEPKTLTDLIKTATLFPVRRPPQLRLISSDR